MAKLDKDDLRDIADIVTEAMKTYLEGIAERTSMEMVSKVLDISDFGLRRRIEDRIRDVVNEAVQDKLEVAVRWK